jgi:hypothetical protein
MGLAASRPKTPAVEGRVERRVRPRLRRQLTRVWPEVGTVHAYVYRDGRRTYASGGGQVFRLLCLRAALLALMMRAQSSADGMVRSVSIVCHPPQLGSGQPHKVNLTG